MAYSVNKGQKISWVAGDIGLFMIALLFFAVAVLGLLTQLKLSVFTEPRNGTVKEAASSDGGTGRVVLPSGEILTLQLPGASSKVGDTVSVRHAGGVLGATVVADQVSLGNFLKLILFALGSALVVMYAYCDLRSWHRRNRPVLSR
jgi:hypothetical protein